MKLMLKTFYIIFLFAIFKCDGDVFYGAYKKNGVILNLMSTPRNQNQPKICGASWAFSIASSMSDQFNLIKTEEFPEVNLSPQMLISCFAPDVMRTCDYLNSTEEAEMEIILTELKQDGIVDESCNNWHADVKQQCNNKAKCMDCANGENIHNEPNCYAKDYHSFKLRDYVKLTSTKTGSDRNLELANLLYVALMDDGPAVCHMNHSNDLFHYRSDNAELYTDNGDLNEYSTWVSVVGIVTLASAPNVTKAWVIRHSFGENVGHNGLIYINADPDLNSYK